MSCYFLNFNFKLLCLVCISEKCSSSWHLTWSLLLNMELAITPHSSQGTKDTFINYYFKHAFAEVILFKECNNLSTVYFQDLYAILRYECMIDNWFAWIALLDRDSCDSTSKVLRFNTHPCKHLIFSHLQSILYQCYRDYHYLFPDKYTYVPSLQMASDAVNIFPENISNIISYILY